MKQRVRSELRKRKRQIECRLGNAAPSADAGRPVLSSHRPHYEMARRTRAMPLGHHPQIFSTRAIPPIVGR